MTDRTPAVFANDKKGLRRSQNAYLQKLGGKTTLGELIARIELGDLILSVAAENRNDWQPEECTPIDAKLANEAFAEMVKLYDSDIKAKTKRASGILYWDEVVDEAWARGYVSSWSARATSRFAGLRSLPVYIIVIASNLIQRRRKELGRTTSLSSNTTSSHVEAPKEDHPSKAMEADEQVHKNKERIEKIARVLKYLTPRQRLIAEMVWTAGEPQVVVAQKLACTEANISIHLSEARKRLGGLGFWPED